MRGIDATGWAHLISGFIVVGAGTALINPPLASTAIGIVEPQDAGMASGINTTFRQVGIATGVAALGSIFSHQVRTKILAGLIGALGISAGAAHRIATGFSQGDPASGLGSVPHRALARTTTLVHTGFADGLSDIFLIGAILAAVAGVLAFALIRNRDFAPARLTTRARGRGSATGRGAQGPTRGGCRNARSMASARTWKPCWERPVRRWRTSAGASES